MITKSSVKNPWHVKVNVSSQWAFFCYLAALQLLEWLSKVCLQSPDEGAHHVWSSSPYRVGEPERAFQVQLCLCCWSSSVQIFGYHYYYFSFNQGEFTMVWTTYSNFLGEWAWFLILTTFWQNRKKRNPNRCHVVRPNPTFWATYRMQCAMGNHYYASTYTHHHKGESPVGVLGKILNAKICKSSSNTLK